MIDRKVLGRSTVDFVAWERIPIEQVPTLSAGEMREVDRIMVEELGIELVQMMENAGSALATLVKSLYRPSTVVVLAGRGGNGGGGLVGARHLANRGVAVTVAFSSSALESVTEHQLRILQRMGVQVTEEPEPGDVIVDALIGYNLRGDPSGRAAELIEWSNGADVPVVSLDTPSGLDVTTGRVAEPCIEADATVTLALPKAGLARAPQVGRLFLADISVPPLVYTRFGKDVEGLFTGAPIVEVLLPQ